MSFLRARTFSSHSSLPRQVKYKANVNQEKEHKPHEFILSFTFESKPTHFVLAELLAAAVLVGGNRLVSLAATLGGQRTDAGVRPACS